MLERLNCLSPYGIEKIRGISPIGSAERLNRHFDNIEKIIFLVKESKSKFDEIANCLAHFKNIRGIIKKCQNGNGLNEIDLFEIKGFLLILEKFIPLFDELPIFAGIGFVSMIDALNILDPQNQRIAPFSVSNEFSAALKEIRREKTLIENMPKDDNFTAKRAEIVALEQAEEERVMRQLSEKLRKYCEDFYHNTDNIGELDLTIAKALQAMEYGAIRPEIGGNSLLLQDMYNPYVAEILAKVNKKFTEISLKLENGATVITGANMGGKSVALKTAVLNIRLALMGFFVFAQKAAIPLFDDICFIHDDAQSIPDGLSSFGAEIYQLNQIIPRLKNEFLFIALDEPARTTNPAEGAAIVRALVSYLADCGCVSVITTHYDKITSPKIKHYQTAGLSKMADDMDYRLFEAPYDAPIPHNALNICRIMGMDKELIDMIERNYQDSEFSGL